MNPILLNAILFNIYMGNINQINIKNHTYYFFNDMISIKDFDSSLLKIGKKSYKNIDIYSIGYITIKKIDNYESLNSANLLYFLIGKADGYIKENNGNKYLVFTSTGGNKKLFTKLKNFGMNLNILLTQ